ncbi:UNVERIFIED_CONTAM: hypothetical protein Sradi_3804400 [Sesamum radiatum]|uniref:Uncharacterized protein n=1 Tax=Sesamum radiatum TaxID=300843 RepID=A0AAW2Q062_SESRA
MSSGMPTVPRGRGRGCGRGPTLPTASPDASRIGGTVCFPSPPSATPQTPDNIGPSDGAPASEEVDMQSVVPAAAPVPPPPPPRSAVPPTSTRQYISLDDARSDRYFHQCINAMVQGHFPPPMAVSECRSPIGGTVTTSPFRVFHMFVRKYIRKTFSIVPSSLVRSLWLANEIWLQLRAYWASEGFQQESSKNKANRAANLTASSIVYRMGSSSIGIHKRKLEVEHGRPPKQMKVFERCYKKKEDDGWSRPRAVEETFQKMLEDHQPQPTADNGRTPVESKASMAIIEQQMWLAAVGGKNKGHVFGLGSEANFSSWTYTSP